jgi:integrase
VLDDEKLIFLPQPKNGRAFFLPIGDVHLAILEPLRGLDERWVFPSPKARKAGGHVTMLTRIESGTYHSLRHTFMTTGTRHLGLLEETVGRLLQHATGTFSSRYNKADPKEIAETLRPHMDAIVAKLQERLTARHLHSPLQSDADAHNVIATF